MQKLPKFEALQQVWIALDTAANATGMTSEDKHDVRDMQRTLLTAMHRSSFIAFKRDEDDPVFASDQARAKAAAMPTKMTGRIGKWRELK